MAKQAKRQLAGSGEALPAGSIGELREASADTSVLSATVTDFVSVSLSTGTWLLTFNASAYIYDSGATLKYYVVPTRQNNSAIFFDSITGFVISKQSDPNTYLRMPLSVQIVLRLTADEIIKMRRYDNSGTGATRNLWGQIQAVRIA